MKTPRTLILAAVLPLLFASLSAQVIPVSVRAMDPTPALKSKLRKLVTAQENYWFEHGTYTTDVAALGMHVQLPNSSDSISVQVIQAGGRSWWGRAVHGGHRDRSCVIYIGLPDDFTAPPTTDAAKVKAQNEAEPVCDTF